MSNDVESFWVGALLGAILAAAFIGFSITDGGFYISDETAFDLCKNITNSTAVEPSVENGKLICTIPSYDHTTNIIVKQAGDNS